MGWGSEARRPPAALALTSCAVSGNGPVPADVSAVPVMERSADAREVVASGAVGGEGLFGDIPMPAWRPRYRRRYRTFVRGAGADPSA